MVTISKSGRLDDILAGFSSDMGRAPFIGVK